MTVDTRAIVATDLGICVSGDVGTNHISDRSGLVMTQGRLQFDGIVTPPRGTLISFLVACPQTGKVTRFPKPLRVIRSVAYPHERRSEIEVGCKLTLMKDRKDTFRYYAYQNAPSSWKGDVLIYLPRLDTYWPLAKTPPPIFAHRLLRYCCSRIGIKIAKSSRRLEFAFLRNNIDLSNGYVQMIGDLIRSESCFGRLLPNEELEIVPLDFSVGGKGPILTADNLISIDSITAGAEPADRYIVKYTAVERYRYVDQ